VTSAESGVTDRCSARSLAYDEPLLGTASRVLRWVLLEEPGPWGETALRHSRLPADVAALLRRLAEHPGVKVLLVRRHARAVTTTDARALIVAATAPTGGRLLATTLGDRRDVLALEDELTAFVAEGTPPASLRPHDGPLLLVCTHGRHDTCCAELGRPLASAFADIEPEATWEVSHIGGDRFAGNVVVLPDGIYLGRVPPALAGDVARTLRRGDLPLPYLRGRSAFGVATQAAEVFARQRLQAVRADDLRLMGHVVDGDATTATFIRLDGSLVVATVTATHRSPGWRLTCTVHHEDQPHAFALTSFKAEPH
jgi:hypothetical protein